MQTRKVTGLRQPEFIQSFTLDSRIQLALLEKAFAINPNSLVTLLGLTEIFFRLNRIGQAEKLVQLVLKHDDLELPHVLDIIDYYQRVQMPQKALSLFREYITNPTIKIQLQLLEADLLKKNGLPEEAKRIYKDVYLKFPEDCGVLMRLASLHYRNRNFDDSLKKCEKICSLKPRHIHARELMNNLFFNNYIRTQKPGDFSDLILEFLFNEEKNNQEEFLPKIIDLLSSHDHWVRDPLQYPTTQGAQLIDIFNQSTSSEKCLQDLLNYFQEKAWEYIYQMHRKGLDYFDQLPENLSLDIWAVNLTAGGHQKAHTHSNGWVSGVYYLELPEINSNISEGALSFGVSDSSNNFSSLHIITPKEGLLVLFPSYYQHCTIPFSGKGNRLCISFDVKVVK